jgi:hypothetical protein
VGAEEEGGGGEGATLEAEGTAANPPPAVTALQYTEHVWDLFDRLGQPVRVRVRVRG